MSPPASDPGFNGLVGWRRLQLRFSNMWYAPSIWNHPDPKWCLDRSEFKPRWM